MSVTSSAPSLALKIYDVQKVDISSLVPASRNARRHSKKQISKLSRAITTFGYRVPILITREGQIVAGHGRVEAMKQLGHSVIPAIYVDDLNPEQIRLLAISENQLGDLSHFNPDDLTLEISQLALEFPDLDLTLSGFDAGPIDIMLADQDNRSPGDIEPPPAAIPPDEPAVSRPGDIWLIGDHKLACGDALNGWLYAKLLGNERARMVMTDPPFNVPVRGHISLSDQHREFPMASGEMTKIEFTEFLSTVIRHLIASTIDGGIHYLFMDFRHMAELLEAAGPQYSEFLNLCVWVKSNAGLGSFYRSQQELVFVFKAGKAPYLNNVELGRHGRNRTNVWRYPGMSSFGKARAQTLAMHPTVKPVDLVADAILDCSERGDIVLDAFVGSGTTILAAERTGRRGYGIELDAHYVDLAVQRIVRATKATATLAETGQSFAEVAAQRAKKLEAGDEL